MVTILMMTKPYGYVDDTDDDTDHKKKLCVYPYQIDTHIHINSQNLQISPARTP